MADPVLDAIAARRAQLQQAPPSNPTLDAIRARKAELAAQMQAGDAEHDRAMADSYSYRAAMGANPPVQRDPGPAPTTSTPAPSRASTGGSQISPWARDLIDYAGETVGNIPESAENVATGLWDAVTNPAETAEALGKLGIGVGQQINEAVGLPEWLRIPGGDLGLGDQRATAGAAGQALADRYGGWEEFGTTFRDDPVGFALDFGGLAGGAAGAARLPGAAGRLPGPGPRATVARSPIMSPEDVRVATDAVAAGRETVQGVRDAATEAGKRERGIRDFIANAPNKDQLRTQADTAYEAARGAGVTFDPMEAATFRAAGVKRLRAEGADAVLHPKIERLINILESEGAPTPDLQTMEILRRQFGAAAGDVDADTRRLGMIGQELVDDFVDSASKSTGGTLKEARAAWSRMRKSETVERAIEKASTAQQGLEAGLRAEFKSLYRAYVDGRKHMRGFTKDEAAAIKAVAEGNVTNNTLRRIASLSGGSGPQRAMQNLIQGSAVGGGLGFALGGPAGAAVGAGVAPVAGQVAGRMATRGTQRRADLVRAMAARGMTPKEARQAARRGRLAEVMAGFEETQR